MLIPILARISDSNYAPLANAISQVIGNNPRDPQIALRVGAMLANAEEWSLAENAYQYAANWFYPFAEASAYVGLMRGQQGKNGDAWIQEALTLAPDNGLVQAVAGVYWRGVGEYAASETALIQAIILQPNVPSLYAELGITYWEMGNRVDAETWLQTAQILAPNDGTIQNALNRFYEEDTLLVSSPLLASCSALTAARIRASSPGSRNTAYWCNCFSVT